MSGPESGPDAGPEPASPLGRHLAPGRHGAPGSAGVTVAERRAAIVSLAARRGCEPALAAALRACCGIAMPERGGTTGAAGLAALAIAPAVVWLIGRPDRLQPLHAAIPGETASVVDQTCGHVVLRVAGAKAAAALAKGCRIDLDARAFPTGRVARTVIAQIPAVVHAIDGGAAFDLIVPATLARSFVAFAVSSAAEFGCDIGPATD